MIRRMGVIVVVMIVVVIIMVMIVTVRDDRGPSRCGQPARALLFQPRNHLVEAFAGLQIRKDERPLSALAAGIAVHHFK